MPASSASTLGGALSPGETLGLAFPASERSGAGPLDPLGDEIDGVGRGSAPPRPAAGRAAGAPLKPR